VSRALNQTLGETIVIVASDAASLPFPPLSGGSVDHWTTANRCVPKFDLEMRSDSTVAVTLAELFGASSHPGIIVDDTVDSVNIVGNELNLASHGLITGDGPIRLTTSGTLPAGLALTTDYWVIAVNSGSIALATSLANALAGNRVDITSAGSGTHTISDTANTRLVHWDSYGLLGQAADGAISLTSRKGYTVRVKHRPNTIAYAVSATLSANTVSISLSPVQDFNG
jgi:hypothetical protein